MEVKAGYKETEIGIFPKDWNIVPLRDVCIKIRDGNYGGEYPKPHEFLSYGVPFLTSKAIGKDGVLRDDLIDYISAEKHASLDKAHIELDDVLFTNRGASVGAIGFVDSRVAGGNIGPQLTLLRVKPEIAISKYLFQVMKSYGVQKQIQSQDSGSAMNFYSIGATEKFNIPIPSTLAEQEAIAAALSDADILIEALEQFLAKKRQVKQGAMQELFSGNKRLPGFAGEWELRKLGELSEMGSGGTPLSSNLDFYNGDIPWVSISDMTKGGKFISTTDRNLSVAGLNSSSAQMFPAGAVLYAMYASLGECSIADVPLCTSQAILGIRVKPSLSNEFLYYFLTFIKPQVKSMGQQGTQSNLNKGMVQNFQLRLPSVPEQTAIAEILSEMDAEIAALEGKLVKERQVKQGMLQELLTGRIRLVSKE